MNEQNNNNDNLTLGMVLAKLEIIQENQTSFGERIGSLEDNLKAAVWVFRTIKYVGVGLIALLTFNWSNLAQILEKFKNG